MQGIISVYFPARESGLIRAIDGNFYIFTHWEWQMNSSEDPETGMVVNFEPAGQRTPVPFQALKVHPVNSLHPKICDTTRVCAESF